MNDKQMQILASMLSALFVMFIYWLGGGEFVRSFPLAYAVFLASAVSVAVFVFMEWMA